MCDPPFFHRLGGRESPYKDSKMPPVLSRGCPQLGGMQVNSFFLTFMVPYSHFSFHTLYMSRRSCHLSHYCSLKTLSHSKWEPLQTYTLQICVHALIHTHYLLEQNGTQFAAVQASEGPVDKPQRHHPSFFIAACPMDHHASVL